MVAAVKLLPSLILFSIKLLAQVSFSVKREKQEVAVKELKLLIAACAIFRDYSIYNVRVWKSVFKLTSAEPFALVL